MDMSQYLEAFIEEGKEHLQMMNDNLLRIEKNPDDISIINEIFRSAHTLKGMSSTMGFTKLSTLTHDMEDLLQEIRSGKLHVSPGITDLLFKCLDALESYISEISETGSEGGNVYDDVIKALAHAKNGTLNQYSQGAGKSSVLNGAANVASAEEATQSQEKYDYVGNVALKAVEEGKNAYIISIRLDKGCVLKAARAFIIFQTLEKYCTIINAVPSVEDIEDEKFDNSFEVTAITDKTEEFLLKEINSISEIEKVDIIKYSQDLSKNTFQRPSASITSSKDQAKDTNGFEGQNSDNGVKKGKTGKTVRVDIERLDVLLNLVSELIIQKTRLTGFDIANKSQEYTETVEYIERITTSLHDAVMKVRMVPLENVFNRFPRMIRDISKELGKEINFTIRGQETELDRTVIDEIGDPLIHILRNSIDHGIETSEKRRMIGKPETGNIELCAYQEGNNVIIEVSDDGNGIDVDKVRNKAISMGLVDSETASTLSEEEIIDFLFRPSFSTADKITDISGRGVGLDVVKTKIQSLGGAVEVRTQKGKGTRFIIRLPLTLAIIQALLVEIGKEKYAIQLASVQQILNISEGDIKSAQKKEMYIYMGSPIPVYRLAKILEVPQDDVVSNTNTAKKTLVVVKKGERLSGLLVDSVIGQQEIVQKSLGNYFRGNKLVTSATILGDGKVALILDVNTLVR